MNILELYEQGYREFKFSDGISREVHQVLYDRLKDKMCFKVNGGAEIWYWDETGGPNIKPGEFPHVTGVEGGGLMSNKRDEIQRAIKQGLFCKPGRVVGDSEAILEDVMAELDSLVERWTDEETAEDLDKSITPEGVYEGMRVRIVKEDPGSEPQRPVGATGTIVKDDGDDAPGVCFDPPNEGLNRLGLGLEHPEYTKGFLFTNLDKMEKLEDNQ